MFNCQICDSMNHSFCDKGHSPGPWTLFDLSEDNDPEKKRNCREWSLVRGGPLAYLKTDWDERGEANARLIAAAPEMLEALRDAENVIRYAAQEATGKVKREIVGGWVYHADALRAIIAKAEGRE